MPHFIDTIELILRWLCAVAGLGTLAYAVDRMLAAQSRPTGLETGAARKVLRTPYLVAASIAFILAGYIFWKPLPIHISPLLGLILTIAGAMIFLFSLSLYLWGLRTLRTSFNASSGFGVRLNRSHQLVTCGPYAYSRHPMYLAVIAAGWGGLFLYQTWSMLIFAVMMFGLIYRARKEEEAMSLAFGDEWAQYTHRVPAWFPRVFR
jgi:protein-S-isoprenylcysteine O-methyltransferase Ste14